LDTKLSIVVQCVDVNMLKTSICLEIFLPFPALFLRDTPCLVRYTVLEYSRTSLSRMAKIQGICPGQRIIRDSELGFGVKKFRIQGISSGTAGDPGKRDPGQRGATVMQCAGCR